MKNLILLIIVSVLIGCTTSPSPVLPPKTLEPVKNSIQVSKMWTSKVGEGAGENYLRLTPVLEGNVIYTVDHTGTVLAFDVNRRDYIWKTELGEPGGSPIALHDGVLFLGTSAGQVFALATSNGKVEWHTQMASEILARPAVDHGRVVVRCVNGDLAALDAATGKQLWLVEERTPALTLRGTSTPQIYNDLVLSAFDSGKLKVYALTNGTQLWEADIAVPRGRTDLERIVDLDADPVVRDDVVYTVAYQGRLAAVQLGSGRILWQRDIDSYLDMVVDAYRIYIVSSTGEVWALDRNNGATLWKQDALLRRGLTAPVIHRDFIVLGDYNGYLHWLRRDNGKLDARIRLQDYDYTSPSLDESEDNSFPKSRDILAQPVLQGDRLLAMDRYGNTEVFEVTIP